MGARIGGGSENHGDGHPGLDAAAEREAGSAGGGAALRLGQGAGSLHDAGTVLDDLAGGIATPLNWRDATALLGELGTTLYVQTPPGRVLARIAATAHPDARVISLAHTTIADAALLTARHRAP